jgi:hypothetical protein
MNHEDHSRRPLDVETSLWILVVATALAMRLAQLGAAPLSVREAREAMAAWLAASGQGFATMDYSPFLLAANGLLFTLLGTSDGLARLLPALFGGLLVLSPLLLRRHLGRVGALAAGVYLTVSPTALVASRQLAGTTIAATGVMVFAGSFLRFIETKDRVWLTVAAIGVSLAVASDATAYALLVPLGLACVVLCGPWAADWRSSRRRDLVLALQPHMPHILVTFALALLGLSTGLGWNLAGGGAIGGLLVDWFGRFQPSALRIPSLLMLLTVYELFGLAFGIGGLIWGLREGHRPTGVLGLWAGLELLLLVLMPGRRPTDLLWAVLPLAFLMGMMVELLVRGWSSGSDTALSAAYAVLVLVLWVYAYLMLARYAAYGDRADLALVLIAAVLQALLGLSFGLALGSSGTVHTAVTATGVALLAFTLSAGWGAVYEHPTDPREALLSEPTAMGIHDLVQTLGDLSWQQTGMPTTLEFALAAPADSVLAWYLRGFDLAHRVDRPGDVTWGDMEMVVVVQGRDGIESAAVAGKYRGQDFALRRDWSPQAIGCRFWESDCNVAIGWYLFRDVPPLPEPVEWATLWRPVAVTTDE